MKLIGGTMEWKRERSKYFDPAWTIIIIMIIMMAVMIRICLLKISYFLQFQLPAASLSVQGHGFER